MPQADGRRKMNGMRPKSNPVLIVPNALAARNAVGDQLGPGQTVVFSERIPPGFQVPLRQFARIIRGDDLGPVLELGGFQRATVIRGPMEPKAGLRVHADIGRAQKHRARRQANSAADFDFLAMDGDVLDFVLARGNDSAAIIRNDIDLSLGVARAGRRGDQTAEQCDHNRGQKMKKEVL